MSSATTQPTRGQTDGKRGKTGRRVNNRGKPSSAAISDEPPVGTTNAAADDAAETEAIPTADEAASDDSDICWICAEKIKYYSISECNHTTCHVCALRLRALYKRQECTFCKVSFRHDPLLLV